MKFPRQDGSVTPLTVVLQQGNEGSLFICLGTFSIISKQVTVCQVRRETATTTALNWWSISSKINLLCECS